MRTVTASVDQRPSWKPDLQMWVSSYDCRQQKVSGKAGTLDDQTHPDSPHETETRITGDEQGVLDVRRAGGAAA
jgi:hypothetical protein